ncbi:LysR family transcriptional regulator [Motilimonas cestriensis]|uniref:LysR family transcriptional regulator n=1 Tax=Motilimonas cestriensis TaxID=2742685 RepID=A0ABS8W8V3_9GAMM|nr:LysR family transcriptional regulator [Motilimonas cestriensis]MCE2593810.1 LysR family transcriptional regulator [Motilimonas cestriensis]
MSRLNYHHLFYFWRVAVVGNLTQVARELHISQSALSVQIKQLEHNMDVALFERSGRSLKLTDMGTRVLAYANDIFSKGEELESFLIKGVEAEIQHISIGVLTTLSRNFVESFITPLLADPKVSFSLTARRMNNLLVGLANHELDLVLTNRPVALDNHDALWQTQLVSRQPLSIVGPKANKIHTTFPQGYDDVRWVLPGKATEIRSAFNSLCASWQYQPDVKAEADDMAMLRLLARDSGALAVLPTVVVKDEIAQGILEEYQRLPNAFEHFYAITAQRKFVPEVLLALLQQHQKKK